VSVRERLLSLGSSSRYIQTSQRTRQRLLSLGSSSRYIQTSQRDDQTDRKTEEKTQTRTGAGISGIETRERNRDCQRSRYIEIETGTVTSFRHMLQSLTTSMWPQLAVNSDFGEQIIAKQKYISDRSSSVDVRAEVGGNIRGTDGTVVGDDIRGFQLEGG
jgi:hypothetical protein